MVPRATTCPVTPSSEGDGIIQLSCLADNGPFHKGMHFGYGHAEHDATVKRRKTTSWRPANRSAHAGFANVSHVHFMVNDGSTTEGRGDRDPMPFVKYAIKYGSVPLD